MHDARMDAKIMLRAAEIVEMPGQWGQGMVARDARGYSVSPFSPEAVRWCLIGALVRARYEVLGEKSENAPRTIAGALRLEVGSSELALWNDRSGRRSSEVAALLRSTAATLTGEDHG